MVKRIVSLGVMIGVLAFVQPAFAEKTREMKKDMPMIEQGGNMGEGMMSMMGGKEKMMGHPPMCGMMMKHMMPSNIVSLEEGGLVVLAGNKLLKYDDNLEMVKEVEIPMDMSGMQKMMDKMKEDCPMRKEMMGGESQQAETE